MYRPPDVSDLYTPDDKNGAAEPFFDAMESKAGFEPDEFDQDEPDIDYALSDGDAFILAKLIKRGKLPVDVLEKHPRGRLYSDAHNIGHMGAVNELREKIKAAGIPPKELAKIAEIINGLEI